MNLGVDIGTSSVKAVILDEAGRLVAESSAPLSVSRPFPLWSEQDPDDWVSAAEHAVCSLPRDLRSGVKAIGLAGQMHGATLIGRDDRPLRPAILWNDGRSSDQCFAMSRDHPELISITGNKPMAGFTAPKLAWVRQNEPDNFASTAKVLLPKDSVRLAWTGDYATDVSDASGTLWLDVADRQWSEAALAAVGLGVEHMPALFESADVTGKLRPETATRLGVPRVQVVAGAGDQAAGAIGAGITAPGDASLALGTSDVLFTVTETFRPNAEEAVHAFCHAVPHTWHQMAVILSAASAVEAVARMTGFASTGEAIEAAEAHGGADGVLFLPYLTGEWTPHDDPRARGCFFGLNTETTPAALVHAALEGVALAFADGRDALRRAGGKLDRARVIGGGARSSYWGRILASVLDIELVYSRNARSGPAQGAAMLAGVSSGQTLRVQSPPDDERIIAPDSDHTSYYADRLATWRALYRDTKHLMPETIHD